MDTSVDRDILEAGLHGLSRREHCASALGLTSNDLSEALYYELFAIPQASTLTTHAASVLSLFPRYDD